MSQYIPYAYYKTIDGEEVREFTKENFEKLLGQLDCRVLEKSDRTLYFVNSNATALRLKFFKDDYFEVLKRD